MKVLITGAGGYLAQSLRVPFEENGYKLKLMDIRPFESRHEVIVGDVTNLEDVRKALVGVDGVVISHMAPRVRGADYPDPAAPFDINVKGTANLLFAAAEMKIKKVVLISTMGILGIDGFQKRGRTLPSNPKDLYSLTKQCQEVVAQFYQKKYQMQISSLRVGYIMNADTLSDKYGRKIEACSPALIDPRDIGEVARLCLEKDDIEYETFHVMGVDAAYEKDDVRYTCERLNWKPKYNFGWLPLVKQ
jgi:nucleoside-diphosphate-sugar epimerase